MSTPSTLTEWQKRLESHFAALAQTRAGTGYPIFALEHGLTAENVRAIKELLRARISNDEWLGLHWLVWVVYATEFGYEYVGDEYWQSFEEFTPFWRERGKREWLRDWFKRFHEKYTGIAPSGKWAVLCKYIAWPITHAILPRYLQTQFAKALYDLRYQLARLDKPSAHELGQFLRLNASNVSSRFHQFLQQEDLTGQLALALLRPAEIVGEGPVFPPTLERLVGDLGVAQHAKEWLKETQRVVGPRILGAHTSDSSATSKPASPDSSKAETLDLRPRFILQPTGSNQWAIHLELPSFRPVADLSPEYRAFLLSARCQIAGTWTPAGALVTGPNKRVVIRNWPSGDTPLVRFDKQNPKLEALLAPELRLPRGPHHLFKITGDGSAIQVISKNAQPRRAYLVLSEAPLPPATRGLKPVAVDCRGLYLSEWNIPTVTTPADSRLAQMLGFQLTQTVRIRPVGLPPKYWDGDGVSEWLTTDSPCFSLQHDTASVTAYAIRFNAGPPERIAALGGEPTYFRVPPLPAGRHVLTVRPIINNMVSGAATEGTVILTSREPRAWVPGTTHYSGLYVTTTPASPSLDDLLDGGLTASIHGPAGRSVTFALTLWTGDTEKEPLTITQSFVLPVKPAEFSGSLRSVLQRDSVAWKAQESSSGRLVVDGGELGQFVLPLDREYRPVRCATREHHGTLTLRILEDNQDELPVSAVLHTFQEPCVPTPLTLDAQNGCAVPPPGGLISVRKGDFQSTLIASSSHIKGGLKGLVIEPNLNGLGAEPGSHTKMLAPLSMWRTARVAGPLAELRRARVTNAILAKLYRPYCGERWFEAESTLASKPTLPQVDMLQRLVGGMPEFAAILRKESPSIGESPDLRKEWFGNIARTYGIREQPELSHFALQFASQPELLAAPFLQPVLSTLLDDIKRHGILMRGARFVAILWSLDQAESEGVLLPRWQ